LGGLIIFFVAIGAGFAAFLKLEYQGDIVLLARLKSDSVFITFKEKVASPMAVPLYISRVTLPVLPTGNLGTLILALPLVTANSSMPPPSGLLTLRF